MSTINIGELDALLAPHTLTLKDFKQLGDTPFRLNAFNGVYAPAKAGKTHFVLEQLNSLDTDNCTVVWLDGDRNSELKDKFPNIHHKSLSLTDKAFDALLGSGKKYNDYIFIIDSFKDFTFGHDIDTNMGAQKVLEKYQKLLDMGATLVIIFHSTKIHGQGITSDFKLKGNADTIESKMDFLYKLHRTKENMVKLTVICSREASLNIGEELSFGDKETISSKIKEVVKKEPNISLRDLKKTKGLSTYISLIDELKGEVYTIELIKPKNGGRTKKVVKLIND